MNTITQLSDKNYAITKEVIDSMLIDNPSELSELIAALFTLPEGSTATTFIISGAVIDGTAVTNGFAIHEGMLTRIVGGESTGFFSLVETPTVIEGIDDFNNAYKTELKNRALVPASSGIAYADIPRLSLAMKEQYLTKPIITAGICAGFSLNSFDQCYITQFLTANFAADYILAETSYAAGWHDVHQLPAAFISSSSITIVGSAVLLSAEGVLTVVPALINMGGVLVVYFAEATPGAGILTVRFNYPL